jgi:DNA adenine methylase
MGFGKLLRQTENQEALFEELTLQGVKPILKWAGGKTQLLPSLRKAMPSQFGRYIEPFFGGGALFWKLGLSGSLIADSNAELMLFYQVVRDSPELLVEKAKELPVTEKSYYRVRAAKPESLSKAERAARFLYLNKTCYNGLHRVNRKGEFNTPFGGRTNVRVVDEANLYRASAILQRSEMLCGDFDATLEHATRGDFVYLDPPYIPAGKYSDFRRYTKEFFSERDHERLADVFRRLSAAGVKILLSNSCNTRVLRLYEGFWHTTVGASRYINCQSTGRGKVTELLVASYPVEGFDVIS